MAVKNSADRWGWVSLGIHWLTLLMILGLATAGFLMQELANSPAKVQVYSLHKSMGLTVLALTVLRLLWRRYAGVPQPEPGTPAWQALMAKLAHGALYLILLAMPISGWLYNSASGFPLKWFGLIALPKLSGYDPELKQAALAAHETLFLALAAIVTVHALAALKHHYLNRDNTLRRMLPPTSRAKPPLDPGA